MRLLPSSNSTNPGEYYLDYPKNKRKEFLGQKPVKVLFVPYAAATFSNDPYEKRVSERFREIGHDIISIHRFTDPVSAVRNASATVIGGGNLWKLLKTIRDNNLIEISRKKVLAGTPCIAWSSGSNKTILFTQMH
jgi:dipeptidase E